MNFIIDYGALIAYIILTIGVVFQARKIIRRNSSSDIAISEVILRTIASILILWKLIMVADPFLIWGQAIFLAVYLGYSLVVFRYHRES